MHAHAVLWGVLALAGAVGLADARLPDDFVIDYVRVWQCKDLASEVEVKKPETKPEAK